MAITEANRLEMHQALRKALGDTVGDIVMEHLPPTGWGDVARKSDINHLETVMEMRFAAVDTRFIAIDQRFESLEIRFNGVIAGMWALGTVMFTSFVGIFALIATKL